MYSSSSLLVTPPQPARMRRSTRSPVTASDEEGTSPLHNRRNPLASQSPSSSQSSSVDDTIIPALNAEIGNQKKTIAAYEKKLRLGKKELATRSDELRKLKRKFKSVDKTSTRIGAELENLESQVSDLTSSRKKSELDLAVQAKRRKTQAIIAAKDHVTAIQEIGDSLVKQTALADSAILARATVQTLLDAANAKVNVLEEAAASSAVVLAPPQPPLVTGPLQSPSIAYHHPQYAVTPTPYTSNPQYIFPQSQYQSNPPQSQYPSPTQYQYLPPPPSPGTTLFFFVYAILN